MITSSDASPSPLQGNKISKLEFLKPAYFLKVAAVFGLYFAAGKLGLSVPFTSGNVSPIWPASGVALSVVLLFGYRIWPGIFLGAFLVNFLTPLPAITAFGMALGNTSSALLGCYLLKRFGVKRPSLSCLRDVLSLVLAAGLSPVIAATFGTMSLSLSHIAAWAGIGAAWRIWWLGDAMGVLIVAPLFLLGRDFSAFSKRAWRVESLVLCAGLLFVCFVLFGGTIGPVVKDDVLAFVVFPFLIWAAIRFHMPGAAVASFIIAAISIWGTALGHGPFTKYDPLHNASLLQLFNAVISVTGLLLAAVLTEQTSTQQSLLEQAHMLDMANDAILVRNWDNQITYWNEGAERLYGWKRNEVLGKLMHKILRTRFPQPFQEIEAQLLRDRFWQGELVHFARDGARIVVASRWSVWVNREGKPLGFLEFNTDITHNKQAEDSVRDLSGRLLKLQDEERRRIARELHDSVGQMLVALNMNLSCIEKETHLSDKAVAACQESQQLVQQLLKELRTISYLLHPPLLDEAGLFSALQWYVQGFAERSKISVALEVSPDLGRLPPDVETTIFRLIQEALTNIHRHSASPTAALYIVRDAEGVTVEVRDQGKGMPQGAQTKPKIGVGILGMKERVRQLGGYFEMRSEQTGTVVLVTLPLKNDPLSDVD